MEVLERHGALKEKIRTGQPTLGIFVKTPAASTVELLGIAGLDFVALDAEHAPFGVESLDRCLLAAHAAGIPALVRLADAAPSTILRVLDMGAAGIIVPHIKSAKDATGVVSAARYSGGIRGFSGSHRAAGYGAIAPEIFRTKSDSMTIVIGQVEERQGVENICEISAVSDLDAIFIGPADLSASYGVTNWNHPLVEDAVNHICASCRKAGRSVGIFLATAEGVASNLSRGVSLFIISTDQALLLKGTRAVSEEFAALRK